MFDWSFATQSIQWFEGLVHPKGSAAGTRFRLVPGQKSEIAILFGWREQATRLRRFRKAFLSKARGNGKSPLAAGLMTKCALADEPLELAAECLCVATKRDQAKKYVWQQCREFIAARSDLRKRARLLRDTIEFSIGPYKATIDTCGSDGGKADGGGFHVVIVDEIHAMNNTVANRELIEKLEGGMGKRRQDLMIIITTAGNDASKLWLEKYDHSEKVLNQVIDDDLWFAYIFAADDDDDWRDEEIWRKANPLLDISVDRREMRSWVSQAKTSPAKLNSFRRFKLNQRVTSLERAISPELWRRGLQPLPDLTGRPCYAGLDTGVRDDLASWSLVFPPVGDDPRYYLTSHSWLPRDCPHDLEANPWATFIDRDCITITDSESTDFDAIYEHIAADSQRYRIQTVAADPHNAREQLDKLLNVYGLQVMTFAQNCPSYNEPMRKFLDTLAQGNLVHAGDPLLTFAADNVVLKTNSAGLSMPHKSKSTNKIDPIVAGLMAFGAALFAPPEITPNVRVVEWD